ncbi:calcium-dependent protein kinase 18-like isoform X2 [Phoenix dactylifera]|uniref:non-specific serine/threonine protein kinase n=1 Tax=Phoenix dactylifera TaxID=42345 RepID=A0A8B8ZK29_PHODC|nr:calcium-dependent protein kinase 18-like isoform X2 [Phoenix dactylifera]
MVISLRRRKRRRWARACRVPPRSAAPTAATPPPPACNRAIRRRRTDRVSSRTRQGRCRMGKGPTLGTTRISRAGTRSGSSWGTASSGTPSSPPIRPVGNGWPSKGSTRARLCEGGELLDRILAKKDNRYTEKDAAIVVRQMLKVAAECHLHGLVHRDMKPENFLFNSTKKDSPLKATDFGLSNFIKPGKRFRDIVGSAYYVAPEVLKRRSGPESDVWSIGVITYILLCGKRPFWDKTEDGILREVLKNKPDFRRKPWPSISNSAKDFVKKLLVKDPRTRLTAAQALSHPWVREGGDASEIPLDISVLNNMRQFVKYSRFKQFALRALASALNEDELAALHDQFDAIDVDKNGAISLEEMRHALAKDLPWRLKGPDVLEILQAIDSNTDGLVDFSEFVAATVHVHQLVEHDSEKWQSVSQSAFDKFDMDGDGYITPEELQMHTYLRGSIDPLLEEADIDKDGRISLNEFRRLLKTASMSSRNVPSPTGVSNPQKL